MQMSGRKTEKGEELFEICGRIINLDSDKFKTKFANFCQKGQKKVVLEISKIDFLDSFGLGAIVGFHTKLQKEGRELIILNSNPDPDSYMRKLFEMTSLDVIFKVVDSEDKL
jgi:anti-sigma B factor antagonist